MIVDIVTGVGYGDEGKGLTTSWLCRQLLAQNSRPLVVRYGGGNQVGHTVMYKGFLYEHHHQGAGSLLGVPTYYSDFCTVDPIGTLREKKELKERGYNFNLYYDPHVMIVTPLDVYYNRVREKALRHGSVGVGFGATIERNEKYYKLTCQDIHNERLFKQKCLRIVDYYTDKLGELEEGIFSIDEFYETCKEFYYEVGICSINHAIKQEDATNLVMEGHQGVLLDKDRGVFPNVTRSNTTCKNAFAVLNALNDLNAIIDIKNWMITRSYHTRHGNGYFEEEEITLTNNEWETNSYNDYQLAFKVSPLQMDLLEAGVRYNLTDLDKANWPHTITKCLVVSCCDQIENPNEVIDRIKETFIDSMLVDRLYTNWSPEANLKWM